MMKYLWFFLLCCSFLFAKEESEFDILMGKETKHWDFVAQESDILFLSSAKEVFEKHKAVQFTQEGPYKIPPVIHFIWLGPKPFPPQSVDNVRTWIARNPGWRVKFWTDRKREVPCAGMEIIDVADFSFRSLEKCYRESENWGEKSDILRYEILLQEGGVYADHDANCLRSFDGMHRGYDFYCGLEAPHEAFVDRNITCGNGVIGSRPGHPTVAKVIELIAARFDALKEKFRGRDAYSKIEIVMQRTYIALTHALLDTINRDGNVDIVLPAAYFFAKSGIPSLYSKHFYATAWDDFRQRKSEEMRMNEKMVNKLMRDTDHIALFLKLLIGFNILLVAYAIKKKAASIILPILLCALLCGCHKKNEMIRPSSDDFESLSGKGTQRFDYVQTKEDKEHLQLFAKMYDFRKGLLSLSENVYRIPPAVHFIWIGPNPFPRASVENVRMWMAKHPDWTFYFWTDRERPTPCPGMKTRLISELPFLKLKDCFRSSDNFGEKSDLLRYEILYKEGGIYVDHDVKCFKAFDSLNKTYDFYCGIDMPYTSSLPSCIFTTNNLIGIKPHHPILKHCMDALAENWEKIAESYPGADRDAMLNRTLHRTFFLFGEAVKQCSNLNDNRDIVFPAYYFDAPCDELALYARHQYAGVWHESETPFEKKVTHRLMYLSKKSNNILLFVGVMSGLNLLAILTVLAKLRTR